MRGDNMDNDQMRAMYNSFGTLNRPQSYGDDLYNDKENLMPAPAMTQTGTDEAGNPVMAPVEMPEQKNNPILDNVIEYASNTGPATGLPGPVAAIGDTVVTYLAGNEEQRQQVVDRIRSYATPQGWERGIKSVIHSMSNATELEHTKLYENYFYSAQKKNEEIKRIANLLQIDENTFAHNRELYQKAALAADRVERMGKFKKYQDADGNIDMAKIYADTPGLAEVQQKYGTAAAALALGNIDGIKSINEVYDNAFYRFAGSVYAGARRGWIADRRSAIWNAARKENRLPTAEEQAQLDEYAAELNTLPRYNYNTVGNVVGAMVGGAAENMAMIVKSQGAGLVTGAVATRIGGPKAGEIARNIASTYVMAQDIAGNQYEELINKTDAQGRPMYTPEQASWLALSQGYTEAALEQWSLNQMGKAIFGRSAAKSLTQIIKTSPTIEAAKAGIRDYAALKLREAGKAGFISLGSEAFEEFTQSAGDMLLENLAQIMLKGKDADLSSVEDILATSTGQMLEALPAIGGFGLIGFGMNPIANTRAVLGFRSNVRNVVNNKVLIGRMANAHYNEVLDGVWKNKGNIKELQNKAPEAATTILDVQNRMAGMEDGFIDVRELSKENAELVDKIAEANNVSREELAACLDGSGMLQVKTSTLMQLDLKDEQSKAIRDNVTTSLDAFTLAQENNAVKLVKEQMDNLQAYNDKTYKQAVENIIQARFPDAEQAQLAREIIEANYDNPYAEFRSRLNAINAEMDEYIAPVLKELRSGMKQGVDIVRMEGDRDAKYVKQSNNAEWYRNWYADNNRAPNAEELRGLAIDIASGRQDNRYGLMDYQNNSDETRQYFEPVAETLDRLEEERNALLAIQDRMRNLNPGEMVATASLSKEGLKVYDTVRNMMAGSENKDIKKAGAFNALFLARYADNMAKVFSRVRKAPYTAEDFVRDRFRLDTNAVYNEASQQEAAQLFMQEVTAEPSLQRTKDLQNIADTVSTVELNAVSARDPEAQAYMKEQMLKRGMKEEDADGLLAILDGITNDVVELARKYPAMLRWQTKELDRVVDEASKLLVPKLSAFKKNGEYKINIDLGTLCMKREAADVLNQILIGEGMGQQLGPSQLEALKDLLKSYKYLTACDVCFVEAKRVRMLADANKTSYDWKSTLLAAGITDGQVLGKERVFTKKQEERLKRMADPKTYREAFEEYMPQDRRRTKTNGEKGADLDTGTTSDKMLKIAKLFTEDPALAGELDPTTLITTAGTDYLARTYGGHTNIMPTLSGMYGSATSKPLEGFTLYDALSWRKSFDNAALDKNMEDVYAIGGGRAQSFTDFNPILFLDYVQMVADYEARNLPMHVYTKVPSFVQLFGETGIMINMSFVPEIVDGVDEAHAGLKWNEETQEWDYAWHEDSFPIDLAYELRQRKEYGGRVGIIAVGVSKEHIKKLMADPRIDMVIPYHASGMPHSVKLKTGLEIATDYTDVQTAKIPATAKEKIEKKHNIAAEEYLNYSRILREPKFKNPHDAAREYLRRCDEYKCTPVFAEFRNEDGYFKVLEDFRGLDDKGNGVAQAPVRLKLPDNWKEILDEALGDRGKQKAMLEDLKTNEEILSKARAILKAQRLDGEIREVMLKRLRSALGQQKMTTEEKNALRAKYPKTWRKQRTSNVQSLKKSEFLDKLEAAYARDVSAEEAKARVEVFRMNNGIVYGFAQNGQIFLNENAFNANTPAHEFTHIWAKVAQEKNPKLWAEGVNLLKSDAKEMWDRVEKDPLYESIRGDENAVASEVLSRLVGEQNEEFVRELLDPTQKMPKGKGLTKRIQDWLLKVFNEVRSLFDPVDGKPLTFDEFKRMPLKTLWDVNANKQFRKNSVKYLQDLQEQQSVQADAIEMQNELFQQQGTTAKGSISLSEQGQRIIRLFESADQSTFIHEMAHMFLLDLQEISGIDANSQQAKDLKTIMDWAQYKPDQADEYKGTASEAEFRKRDADIKAAEEAGDTAKAQQLKDAWAQERFARGFEEYLRSGEAPAQGLKRAFRAFKRWLVQIYNDVTGAGVRATPEVEAIMARMVASEDEIDALAAANSISRKVVDMGNMPQVAAEKLKDMQDEAHEQAKERMLKRLIRDYENNNLKDLDEKLKQVRKDAREELRNLPCFVVQKLIDDGLDMEAALDIGEFASEQEYKAALDQAGGTLDKAVYRAVAAAKKQILGQMPGKEQLYDMAQEALDSGIHNTEMSEIEAGILDSLKDEYNSVTAKLRRAFEEIDSALDKEASAEMLEALKKSIRNLKYAERWGAQEFVLIKEFENAANKLDESDREAVERLRKKYEQIKEKTLRNKEWVNGIIDANKGMAKVIREQAEYKLNGEAVSVATNPRYWHRQALSSAKRAWDGLKTIRKGQQVDYEDAVRAKRQQAVYEAMEAQAYENQKKYNTWLNGRNGFKAKAQRMANPKFKADANLRFYYNHLMYIYGIRTADAAAPTNLKSITEVLNELRESQQLGVEPPAWIVSAANSTNPDKTYQQLTMSELEQLKKTTDMFYRLATIQNALLTSDDSLDKVEAECALDYENQVGYEGVGNQRINEVKGAMGSYMASMIKSERFLAWLGGEHGAHIKRIYRTLFDAAENEEMEQEKEAKYLRDLYGKHYTKQELRAILNDPVMVTLPDGGVTKLSIGADTNITKENLLSMALNWGNELNRARLAVGLFNCQTDGERLMREAELFQILQDNLTENDWKFVQEMWDHIDSFANPVSHVLEKMIGVPLTRVKRQAFEVQLKDGKILRLAGGYYPIVKDSGKSTRVSEFEQLEEAKQIGGISVMGTGMGTTKERDANLMLNQGPLKLNLDVAHRHIEQQIHIITMRMAVRDAYKILNSKTVRGEIERTFGTDVMKSLNEWVLASWAAPIRTSNRAEQIAASLRSGSIGAIMAYRASTALLNFANIVYMANEIGPVNAVNAVIEFYKHPRRNREAIMAASVYMRNRATNMDRDLGAQNKAILKRYDGLLGKAENAVDKATGGKTAEVGYLIDKYANKMIEETDMFFSLPLYWWQFRQTYDAELAKEGVTEEEARDTANFEATRRVTKVFPSSRKIDSSEVQRSRSEFVKLLTPFFSFSNTMMNAVWNKYYEGKYNGRVVLEDENGNPVLNENGDPVYTSAKKGFIRRYWRFAMAFFMDFMVGAFFETMLRQVPGMLAGTGEDDEDDMFGIGWFKVNKKKYMNNALDSITGGFYGLNAMIDLGKVAKAITEGKSTYGSGRNIGVLSGTVERSTKAFVDLALMLNGSDKIDMLDFMRDASKVYTARTGFSDTLTDAFFNTVRFASDEGYSMDNMADLREYIAKSIFDRKLKKK